MTAGQGSTRGRPTSAWRGPDRPDPARVEVAPAGLDDLDAIRRLDGLTAATARLLADELASPGRVALVARDAQQVVGYVAATGHLGDDPVDTQILDVVVAPAWRRHGIGARLVSALLELVWAQGVRAVTLEVREGNAAAMALYRRLGFRVEGRRAGYYGDGEAALIMWRRR